jgi:CXCXC repeat
VQVWDLETCKCVGTLLRAAKPVAHLELAAGRLYAASVGPYDAPFMLS